MSAVTPLLHFTILLLEEEPVEKTNDDFQIIIGAVTEEGPMAELVPYAKQQHITSDHEHMAQYVLRRIVAIKQHVFKVGDKFHVRVRFQDTVPGLKVVK